MKKRRVFGQLGYSSPRFPKFSQYICLKFYALINFKWIGYLEQNALNSNQWGIDLAFLYVILQTCTQHKGRIKWELDISKQYIGVKMQHFLCPKV
ncbi:hypothetical protein FRX31_008227 [Thalictrum thalictroides]|uniref:Uncharacterized protein n=1 Tax=Thalictrum thalictroides TaxID=46969 RepID=A0A7J6WZB4_THATH|nr:hypothetical protein FRX31_008227 [Thalictrum thalictroides]